MQSIILLNARTSSHKKGDLFKKPFSRPMAELATWEKEKSQVRNTTPNFRLYRHSFGENLPHLCMCLTFACASPLSLMADCTFSQPWAPLLKAWLAQHRSAPVHTPQVWQVVPACRKMCCLSVRSTCPGTTPHQGSHEAHRSELPPAQPEGNTGQKESGFVSTSQPMLWDSAQSVGKVIWMDISYGKWQSTDRVNVAALFNNYSPQK